MLAGLKCPCHGIILDGTLETCCIPINTKNTTDMQNKYYNWKLWCGTEDLDERKYNDVIFILIQHITAIIPLYNKWLAKSLPTPIYSYLVILCFIVNLWWQVLRARCHELFRKRGTLTPPAFKPICNRRNVSFFWGIWALCAAAWVNVAEACPYMEYSGSGTQNRPSSNKR